jgi:thioredoxin-like negative regulator of GroEL
MAVASLLLAGAAQAAAPDLAKAEQLLQAGQAAEAKALFQQALEADPSSVGAHLGLGRAYYALGEYARLGTTREQVDPQLHGGVAAEEAERPDHDQVDRDDLREEIRLEEDEDAGDECDDGADVGG